MTPRHFPLNARFPLQALAAALLLLGAATLPAPAMAQEDQPGLFSRIGRALDRGVVRGRELAAEGAEGAGRGLQRAGEATGRAAERLSRRLRPEDPQSLPPQDQPLPRP